jgi:diguanylate cyclase (GGDEF)-like protein
MLQSQVKHRDFSARFGSCVFTLVLLDCAGEEAARVAGRIHETVSAGFSFEEKTYPVTVSIGMIPITEKAAFAAGLLSSVDKACSSAKKAGGGKTISVDE